jgi:hypothetical protein
MLQVWILSKREEWAMNTIEALTLNSDLAKSRPNIVRPTKSKVSRVVLAAACSLAGLGLNVGLSTPASANTYHYCFSQYWGTSHFYRVYRDGVFLFRDPLVDPQTYLGGC